MCLHRLEQVILEAHFYCMQTHLYTYVGKLYDKFLVQCLKLLRQVLKCEDYRVPTTLLSSGEPCLGYNNAGC